MDIFNSVLDELNKFVIQQPFLALILGAVIGLLIGPIFRPFFRILKASFVDWWVKRSVSSLSAKINNLERDLETATKYSEDRVALNNLFQATVLEVLAYITFGLFTNAILFIIGGILASIVFAAAAARAYHAWQIYKNVENFEVFKSETESKIRELRLSLDQQQTTS
jgi:hypothetical protein